MALIEAIVISAKWKEFNELMERPFPLYLYSSNRVLFCAESQMLLDKFVMNQRENEMFYGNESNKNLNHCGNDVSNLSCKIIIIIVMEIKSFIRGKLFINQLFNSI